MASYTIIPGHCVLVVPFWRRGLYLLNLRREEFMDIPSLCGFCAGLVCQLRARGID